MHTPFLTGNALAVVLVDKRDRCGKFEHAGTVAPRGRHFRLSARPSLPVLQCE